MAPFHVCVLGKNPKPLAGVWISTVRASPLTQLTSLNRRAHPQLTFDLITGILLIINALDQPYRQRSQVLERVRRDGALCFIVSGAPLSETSGNLTRLSPTAAGYYR